MSILKYVDRVPQEQVNWLNSRHNINNIQSFMTIRNKNINFLLYYFFNSKAFYTKTK